MQLQQRSFYHHKQEMLLCSFVLSRLSLQSLSTPCTTHPTPEPRRASFRNRDPDSITHLVYSKPPLRH